MHNTRSAKLEGLDWIGFGQDNQALGCSEVWFSVGFRYGKCACVGQYVLSIARLKM